MPSDLAELLPMPADAPPLRLDEGGAVRIGKSRVALDVVVEQYNNGMAPEDMVRDYDTLALADVHAVIAYYLRNREAVRAYLERRADDAKRLRATVEEAQLRLTWKEFVKAGRFTGSAAP